MNIADHLIAIDRAASAYESRIVAARLRYMEALRNEDIVENWSGSEAWAAYRLEEIQAFSAYMTAVDNLLKTRHER